MLDYRILKGVLVLIVILAIVLRDDVLGHGVHVIIHMAESTVHRVNRVL